MYRVLALGPGGVSEPSRDVRVRTFAPVAPPEPLTGARAHVSNRLVSNLGQQTISGGGTTVNPNDVAQGFTTGSWVGGYNVRRVAIRPSLVQTPGEVKAELWSATSDDPPVPDAPVATLTHRTGTLETGKNTFNAPAGTTLKAGTTYFVLFSYTGLDDAGTNSLVLDSTGSTSADTSPPGWSVGRRFERTRSPQGEWGNQWAVCEHPIRGRGSFVLNPDPPGQNVSEPDGGDCAATSATQCRVAVGGSVTGNRTEFDASGQSDFDAFAVDLLEDETYQFDLEGADTGQGTLMVPVLSLISRASGSSTLAHDEDGSGEGRNARFTYSPTESTTYNLLVRGGRDRITGQTAVGTYRLTVRNVRNVSVSEPDGEDCTDDAATTCWVAVDGSATGNIDSDTDVDWFEVQLEVEHKYQFDVEGVDTGQGTLEDPRLRGLSGYVEAAPGTLASLGSTGNRDGGEGKNAKLTYSLDDSSLGGTHYIRVSGENDAEGTYRLMVRELIGSGYGRFMLVEGRLQPGGTLSGTLGVPTSSGIFQYYFAMDNLEVGRYTVDFGTGGIHSIHHFLTDRERSGRVTLKDTWTIVDQGHGQRSFTFDVRPGMEGTHYVLLNILRDDTGDYTATLEKAMPHLRVGRTGLVGEVPADSDGFAVHMEFFSVDLEAGQEYRVDIEGKHSRDEECEDDGGNDEACTLDHTMLGNIQAPDGDYVGGDGNFDDTDDDVGGSVLHFYGGGDRGNTRFTFTAEQDGTHFLKVGDRLFRTADGSGFRAGTFRLSVREAR